MSSSSLPARVAATPGPTLQASSCRDTAQLLGTVAGSADRGENQAGRTGCLSQLGVHWEPEPPGPASGPGTPTSGEGSSPWGLRPSEPTWELFSRCVQTRSSPSSAGALGRVFGPQHPSSLTPASGLKGVLTAHGRSLRNAGSLKCFFSTT